MGLFTASGTRRTKAALSTTTVADPEVVIAEDLFERKAFYDEDPDKDGSIRGLRIKAGTVVRQSYIDNVLFPASTVTAKSPTANLTASATATVVFDGTKLEGVSGVTVGGTAATALTWIKTGKKVQLQVTAPAKAAGTYDVVFATPAGSLTKTGYLTYA